jgi:stage V sporulation protein SpoVS
MTDLSLTGEKILQVGGGTNVHKLASAIVAVIENDNANPVVEYIGAGAGQQAVKGCIIANSILLSKGLALALVPQFQKRAMPDNPDMVSIQLRVKVSRS